MPISEWNFRIVYDRGQGVPVASIYSFESDNIIFTKYSQRLNVRVIDSARLAGVISVEQVKLLRKLCIEWVDSGKLIPGQADATKWAALIGDKLGNKRPFHPRTLWDATFGRWWKHVDVEWEKREWKPQSFITQQVPERFLTKAELKKREGERSRPIDAQPQPAPQAERVAIAQIPALQRAMNKYKKKKPTEDEQAP